MAWQCHLTVRCRLLAHAYSDGESIAFLNSYIFSLPFRDPLTTLLLLFGYSLAAIVPKQVVLLLLLLLLAATIVGAHHLAYGLCELLWLDIALDA